MNSTAPGNTSGRFTGIEQRADLIAAVRQAAADLSLADIYFLHGNLTHMTFENFDASISSIHSKSTAAAIASTVPFNFRPRSSPNTPVTSPTSSALDRSAPASSLTWASRRDSRLLRLRSHPLFGDDLKLWIKQRAHDPALDRLGLRAPRSFRGRAGWAAGRG